MIYKPTNTEMLSYPFDRRYEMRKLKTMNAFAQTVSKLLFDETEEFIFRVADYYQNPAE
jgi:hypothetical protein